MKLSVIIPTHNRPEVLLATLQAIEKQTLARDRFEVIVVDDGSDENSRSAIKKFKLSYRYLFLEKPQGGLASARNFGADHASGQVLYFLDDDVIPARETLEQHLKIHETGKPPLVVLGSLPYPENTKMTTFLWYMEKGTHYDLYKNPEKYPGGQPPLPPLNGNSSVSRDTFFESGKYDDSFKVYGGEDLEMGYRLKKAGVRFVYNPLAIGFHNHIKNFSQFCNDMEKAGESLIRIYRKYPEIKRSKKIDLLVDPLKELPWKKKLTKLIMTFTMWCPWILAIPKSFIRLFEPVYGSRQILFPCYRWIAYHHYAVGMKKGLGKVAGAP